MSVQENDRSRIPARSYEVPDSGSRRPPDVGDRVPDVTDCEYNEGIGMRLKNLS